MNKNKEKIINIRIISEKSFRLKINFNMLLLRNIYIKYT